MKALISKKETVETGYRVAQVEPDDNIFPLAIDMFWADCPDTIIADMYWYDPENESFVEVIIPA